MSVLVVAAHPDDETIGAGGTIARLTSSGTEVAWLILGDGVSSRSSPSDPRTGSSGEVEARAAACLAAADRLGVTDVTQCGLPDNRFDSVDLLEIVRTIEASIERLRPSTVLTHHRGDVNVDHRITHEAVLAATRPLPGAPVRTVLAFEVPSSTEWGFGSLAPFEPSVFWDVSGTIDRKLEAFAEYDTEARAFPHPRSTDALRALAAVRGSAVGTTAAEAFVLVRTVC